MAIFEGTIKEFTKFVGPYSRINVALIASKHKKLMGKCEECGNTGALDAAHIKGKERVFLIANILSEFIEDDIIKIDLSEFEERFVSAHLPIETSIRHYASLAIENMIDQLKKRRHHWKRNSKRRECYD